MFSQNEQIFTDIYQQNYGFFFLFQKYELAAGTAKNKMYAFPKYVGYNADHSVPYENQYVLMRVK